MAVVASSSIVPLLNDDLIRPLDDLVARHGASLQRNQVIKDKGLMELLLAASDKPGWDLAAEFVNMYLGTGGKVFADGSAKLAIDNDSGRKVLDKLRAMTGFICPDNLTYHPHELNKLSDASSVALMSLWSSSAGAAIVRPRPIPKRRLRRQSTAAPFRRRLCGWSAFTVPANTGAATWLLADYQPGPTAIGVVGNATGGALVWCSSTWACGTPRCRLNWPVSSRERRRLIRRWPM